MEEDKQYESCVIIAFSAKKKGFDEITKQIREIGYEIRDGFHNSEKEGIFEVAVPKGKEDDAIGQLGKYDFKAIRKISQEYIDKALEKFEGKGCCGFGCSGNCGNKRKKEGCF